MSLIIFWVIFVICIIASCVEMETFHLRGTSDNAADLIKSQNALFVTGGFLRGSPLDISNDISVIREPLPQKEKSLSREEIDRNKIKILMNNIHRRQLTDLKVRNRVIRKRLIHRALPHIEKMINSTGGALYSIVNCYI